MTKEYSIIVSFGKEKNKIKREFNEHEIKEVIEGVKEGLKESELAIRVSSNTEAVTKLISKLKAMKIIYTEPPPKKIIRPKRKKKVKNVKKK